ncbi:unnamed protein product [Cylicocyclus nassatus]|uniref:Uncharacterized protein n=1 Tax=Cylicocyclus nassatus TaxID=53992 RepID=A0AA36HB17_CYLNA|nr:unnamed protein product [Cylicocyclus nassatus]
MSDSDVYVVDQSEYLAPFMVFFAIGFLYGILLAYMHTRVVSSMVKERISHLPRAKKVKKKKKKKKRRK